MNILKVWVGLLLTVMCACAQSIEVTVRVNNFDFVNTSNVHFDPVIHVGDSVRWVLVSGFHSSVSAAGQAESWSSGNLNATGFSKTFTHVGTFNYHCGFHGFDAGGGQSGGMSGHVTVLANDNPVPAITTITPSTRQGGLGGFTLTVNGSSFVSTSVVRWNGSDRTTTFGSAAQLTASITAADVAVSGSANVTVFNPAPGGGTSNGATFTVTPGAPQNVAAGSIVTTIGEEFSGGLAEILTSNDEYYQALSDSEILTAQMEIRTTGAPTVGTNPTIGFTIETSVTRPGLSQAVALYNHTNSTYEGVDGRIGPIADSTVVVSLTGGARFVDNATHELRARVTWNPVNDEDPSQDGWLHMVDIANWQISP